MLLLFFDLNGFFYKVMVANLLYVLYVRIHLFVQQLFKKIGTFGLLILFPAFNHIMRLEKLSMLELIRIPKSFFELIIAVCRVLVL